MIDTRTIVDRSRRHHAAETAAETVRIPGQTIGHPGGGGDGNVLRIAYCKVDAGTGIAIQCYLDAYGSDEEVTVYCSISGGENLNKAVRRLADGDWLIVIKINDVWYACEGFNDSGPC
ncbi:MAG: hypothetical protein LLF76_02415 [Planctomycetaceae bacterium]|nr:hypothetical protein [Planctomycetaceae bacterium]